MKKLYILIIFFICLISVSYVDAKNKEYNLELFGKVIYIDAGHGGVDPGSVYKNIYEKDINLEICLKLEEVLEREGAIVYLTRYGDYDLSSTTNGRKKSDLNNRARMINNSNADMYISIHLNSINSSTWKGAQVFFDDVNKQNKILGTIIEEQLKEDLKTTRKLKEINNMLMNRKIKIPGVLIEAGFLSNSNDRYLLRKNDYQYKICESIKKGIIKYFNM